MSVSQQTPHFGAGGFSRRALDWQDRAACRGEDLSLFFGPAAGEDREHPTLKAAREEEAKWLCSLCPVRIDCLRYALDTNEAYGIWGGLDEDERKRRRRSRVERARRARKQSAA